MRIPLVVSLAGVLALAAACGDHDPAPAPTPPPAGGGGPGGGGGGGGEVGPFDVVLEGSLQKGPFVIGSTLEVALLDGLGNPTGEVFPTTITDDLGSFSLSFSHAGPVSLVGSGFHYDEVTGRVSQAPIALRALASITAAGPQATFVNVVTHLTERRILALLASDDFPTVAAQAEDELVTALGIGPPGYDPQAAGVAMNILGGGSPANDYLFAVSATLVEAATLEAGDEGSVDGELQELLNTMAIDLEDGALDAPRAQLVAAAESSLLTDRVEQLLAARLAELGRSAPPPDLDAVIDTDQDDLPNAEDSCPWIANPTQDPVLDGVCLAFDRPATSDPVLAGLDRLVLGDLDGDDDLDGLIVTANSTLAFLLHDGAGSYTVESPQSFVTTAAQLVDIDGDGIADVISQPEGEAFQTFVRTATPGTLPPGVVTNQAGLSAQPFAVGLLDGDTFADLVQVASFTTGGDTPIPLTVLLGDGQGTFVPAAVTAMVPAGQSFASRAADVAEATGDPHLDVVIAGFNADFSSVVTLVLPGDGDGSFGAPIASTAAIGPGDAMNPGAFALVDATGDGLLDVVVARAASLHVVPATASGAFGPAVTSALGFDSSFGRILTAAELTGDDLPDLVLTADAAPVAVLPNQGQAAFGSVVPRLERLVGEGALLPAHDDVDGVGVDDLFFLTGPDLRALRFVP